MSKRRALRSSLIKEHKKPVLLYRLVYRTLFMRVVAFLIFGFFILQPTAMIYANENTSSGSTPIETAPDVLVVDEVVEDVVVNSNDAVDTGDSAETNQNFVEEVIDTPEVIEEPTPEPKSTTTTKVPEILETIAPPVVLPPVVATATASTTPVVDDVSTSTIVSTTTTTDVINTATSTTEIILPETPSVVIEPPPVETPIEEVLTEEEIIVPEITIEPSTMVTNDESRFQFGEHECLSVGQEAFYCNKQSTSSVVTVSDGAYVDFDSDGDSEIFYRERNNVTQITNNKLDDLAPDYDPKSRSIVWHRLIDGRYEVMSYDLNSNFETQLTRNNVNDMEPTRSGEYTVWQRWNDNNWDVILFDGEEETQISDSIKHDVAPSIRDGYVIWHTTGDSGDKLLSVYEISSGNVSSISDPEGGHVDNPRFVLVYDASYENGDIVTRQYDPETGEIKTVGSMPAPALPPIIPEPDSTGETRALISVKTSSRDENIIDSDAPVTKPNGTTTPNNNVVDTNDVELQQTGTSTENITDINLATTTEEVSVLPLTEFDVIVPPYESASSSAPEVSVATSTRS